MSRYNVTAALEKIVSDVIGAKNRRIGFVWKGKPNGVLELTTYFKLNFSTSHVEILPRHTYSDIFWRKKSKPISRRTAVNQHRYISPLGDIFKSVNKLYPLLMMDIQMMEMHCWWKFTKFIWRLYLSVVTGWKFQTIKTKSVIIHVFIQFVDEPTRIQGNNKYMNLYTSLSTS